MALLCLFLFSCEVPGNEDDDEGPVVRISIENEIESDREDYVTPISSVVESYLVVAKENGNVIWEGSTVSPYFSLELASTAEVRIEALASDGSILGSGTAAISKDDENPKVVVKENDGYGSLSLEINLDKEILGDLSFVVGDTSYPIAKSGNVLSLDQEFPSGFFEGYCTIQGQKHEYRFRILAGRTTELEGNVAIAASGILRLTVSSEMPQVVADYKIDSEIASVKLVSSNREWNVELGENEISLPEGEWNDCKIVAENSEGIEIGGADIGTLLISSGKEQEISVEITPLEGPSSLIFVIPGYDESASGRLSLLVDGKKLTSDTNEDSVRFVKEVDSGSHEVVIKDGEDVVRSFSAATLGKTDLVIGNPVWLLELDVQNGVEESSDEVISPPTDIEKIVIDGAVSALSEGSVWSGYVYYEAGGAITVKGINSKGEEFCVGEAVLGEDEIGKHVQFEMILEEAKTGSAKTIFKLDADGKVDFAKLSLIVDGSEYDFDSATGMAELSKLEKGTYNAELKYDEATVGKYSFRIMYGTELEIAVKAFLSDGSFEIVDGITGSSNVSVVGLSDYYGPDDTIEFSLDGVPSSADVKVILDDDAIEGEYIIQAAELDVGRHYLKVYVYSNGIICDMTIAGFSIV